MLWHAKLRLRVLACAVGCLLAALGLISILSLPAWPVVGVAVATVAVAVHSMASRLSHPICFGCGKDLAQTEPGEHGVVCQSCGTINPLPNGFGRDEGSYSASNDDSIREA